MEQNNTIKGNLENDAVEADGEPSTEEKTKREKVSVASLDRYSAVEKHNRQLQQRNRHFSTLHFDFQIHSIL